MPRAEPQDIGSSRHTDDPDADGDADEALRARIEALQQRLAALEANQEQQVTSLAESRQAEARLRRSQRFHRATLDALSTHIAVLDEDGVIVGVNAAWKRFAEANEAAPEDVGAGVNYLDVCRAATGPGSEQALAVAAGIGAVLAGDRSTFSLEYPCHAPGQERWFILRTNCFQINGGRRVVVSHEDITERKQAEAALRTSEELHRIILGDISDAVFITDDAGRFTYICPNAHTIFGYAYEEIAALGNIAALLGADLYDPDALRRSGELPNIERSITDKHGRAHHLLVTAKTVSIQGGTVLVTCRDVSERRQARQELRIYEHAIHSSITAVVFGDLDGRFTHANRAFLDLSGYDDEADVIGRHARDFSTDPGKVEAIMEALRTRGHWIGEDRARRRDGSLIDVLLSASVVRDAAGTPLCTLATFLDITERKQGEDKRRQLIALIENSTDFIGLSDIRGHAVYLNRAGMDLVGLEDLDAVRATHIADYVLPEDAEEFRTKIRPVLMRQGYWRGEYRFRHFQTGAPIPVEINGFIVRDPGTKQPLAIAMISRDITERKRLERELLRIGDEERSRIGRDLHDVLGSHLTGATMLAQSLLLDAREGQPMDPDHLAELVRLVREGAEQARALARGLNPVTLERQGLSVALQELAASVRTNTALACSFRDADPLPDLSPETATQLYRIAQEAVTNAVRHADARHIRIRLAFDRQTLVLTVRDDGVGLPSPPPRTGMGHSIMAYRANMIGALFHLDNAPGGGTLVRCSLPIRPALSSRS